MEDKVRIIHTYMLNVKRYLINHLISMMLSGRCCVFLFHQGTERPHQGDVNTRVAIPNTTKEIRNRIMLDPEMSENPSFVYGDGGGEWISYCPVVEHLLGKILKRDLEFCDVGSSIFLQHKNIGNKVGCRDGVDDRWEASWREYGNWLI